MTRSRDVAQGSALRELAAHDPLETGHFTWEDGADDYLRLTRSWIDAHRTITSGG